MPVILDRNKRNRVLRAQRLAIAKSKGTHSKLQFESLKKSCGNICVICNGSSGLLNLERDHIIPLYQGGSDAIENIQPVCAKCNSSKGHDSTDYRPIGWERDYALLQA